MKKATIIRDKLSGQTFAILVPLEGNKLTAFGSSGQGQLWAEWAKASSSAAGILDNLDVSLAVEKDVELTDEFVSSLETTFALADLNELRFTMSQKALLVIEKIKSLAGEEPSSYEQMNEDNEEENVDKLPVVDAAIATIDVAYKQIAIDYKARAFNLDNKRSSMLLQVKGVRAMWDPNMPGGGGWRCPDDTPYGGQFTNRLGRGCTFGAIRRIGRSLMTASLKDITKGFEDDDDVEFPSIYKAGKKLDEVGEKLKKQTGQKYGRRAARRADQIRAEQARQMLKESRPTFRQRYESLGPEVSRRNRVLIAASQTARDIADDQATRGFVSEARRRRRQGIPTPKGSPVQRAASDSDDSAIRGAMSAETRALIAERLRTTASDILEGRRFARRRKAAETRTSKKSPRLTDSELDKATRITTKQIDSILDILKTRRTVKNTLHKPSMPPSSICVLGLKSKQMHWDFLATLMVQEPSICQTTLMTKTYRQLLPHYDSSKKTQIDHLPNSNGVGSRVCLDSGVRTTMQLTTQCRYKMKQEKLSRSTFHGSRLQVIAVLSHQNWR